MSKNLQFQQLHVRDSLRRSRLQTSNACDPCLVYEEKDVDKKSYDDHCALMRNQSPDLRRRMTQAINDPHDADPIATILTLINNHQAESVNLPASRDNALVTIPSRTLQPSINDLVREYQPLPFEILDSGSSLFPQMSNPWDFQQHESEMDSGFYSGLSAPTESDPLLLASQQAEFSCPPARLTTVSNVVEDQVIQTPGSAPRAGEAGLEAGLGPDIAGNFDVEAFFMRWDPNAANASSATDANRE
jgi:hypothetical protein